MRENKKLSALQETALKSSQGKKIIHSDSGQLVADYRGTFQGFHLEADSLEASGIRHHFIVDNGNNVNLIELAPQDIITDGKSVALIGSEHSRFYSVEKSSQAYHPLMEVLA